MDHRITTGDAVAVLGAALGIGRRSAKAFFDAMRVQDLVPGRGGRGTQPLMTAKDVVRAMLVMLASDGPPDVKSGWDRVFGLVTVLSGRSDSLIDVMAVALSDLADDGQIPGVADAQLRVLRPWPAAALRFRYQDDTERIADFWHRDARSTGDPKRDAVLIDKLSRRWRFTGRIEVREVGLAGLRVIADALAGRPVDTERPAWQPQLSPMHAAI